MTTDLKFNSEDVNIIFENDYLVHFIYSDGRDVLFNRYSLRWAVVDEVPESIISKVREKTPIKPSNNLYYRLEQSTKCNLNCQYCCIKRNSIYEHLGEAKSVMSVDVAKSLLDQYDSEATSLGQTKRTVYFYGEEPLAGWETLKEIITDTRFNFFINTNGLLINNEILSYLAKPHVYTIISLDGMYKHNMLRVETLCEYEKIVENYQKLRKMNGRGGFSITVHRDNEDDLCDIVESFIIKYKPDGIGLGLPMYYSDGDTDAANIDIDKFIETCKKLFETSIRHNFYLPYLASKLRPLVTGVFRLYWCEAIGNTKTFLPSGKEVLCSRLLAKTNITKSMLKSWIPINNPYCSKCEAVGICGGGCPWSANMWYENHIDERECKINRALLPYLIRYLTDNYSSSFCERELHDNLKEILWL